jgi:Carboxypeptidase regulatory-like domain
MLLFRAAVSLIGVLCSAALVAQTPDTATLQGTVADPSHAAVTGAQVTVSNEDTGLIRSVDSDSTGRFTVAFLGLARTRLVSLKMALPPRNFRI